MDVYFLNRVLERRKVRRRREIRNEVRGEGTEMISSWAFLRNHGNSGLELLRQETRLPVNNPDIWIKWWFKRV